MTTRILLRCFKHRAAIEDAPHALDAKSLYDLEFVDSNNRPDLELSVYDIEPGEWCRVYLQRVAAAGIDPPRCGGGVDVKPIRATAEPEPETWCFRLLGERHHVIRFERAEVVLPFVVELHDGMHSGTCAVFRHKKHELQQWLHANMGDPEWVTFLADAKPKWQAYPKAPAT